MVIRISERRLSGSPGGLAHLRGSCNAPKAEVGEGDSSTEQEFQFRLYGCGLGVPRESELSVPGGIQTVLEGHVAGLSQAPSFSG